MGARIKLRVKAWHEYVDADPNYEWEWREKICVKTRETIQIDLVPHRLQRWTGPRVGFQGKGSR